MVGTKPTLVIPVENQVRELDPKLLLACVAARRGFSSVIGSRRELELRIASFSRSVYLSKSMTVRSLLMFYLARKLGHDVVTWDEEALVHLPPEMYFSRRLSSAAMRQVSHLFAWGEDNAELWRQYPALPSGTPIHVTGNPRGDLLRPDLLSFYAREVEDICSRYGEFILVNTNFNHVNAFYAGLNLFKPVKAPGQRPEFGRAARGMTRAYAEGLRDHKQAIFDHFQHLIPDLEQAFPDYTIVVRPHPTENQEPYRKIAAGCERVQVTNEGNVVPWLLTTRALVHNGCTTGVEAYVLRVPAISYRATVNEEYDCGFYRLPNLLSHQCFSFEEVCLTLRRILAGELGPADGDERQALVVRHLAAQDGPLACEKIVDVIEAIAAGSAEALRPGLGARLSRWSIGSGLGLARWIISRFQAGHLSPEFQRHRYPGIRLEELRARLSRLQDVLGDRGELKVEQVTDVIFRISP
ncbi:MAG TPA: surface carbohydrate biosynthesis protein [Syntrophobacteria bacterium]|nr:surface carbohydrate biosynthesis protein [Syntrophobacteria bacterium]